METLKILSYYYYRFRLEGSHTIVLPLYHKSYGIHAVHISNSGNFPCYTRVSIPDIVLNDLKHYLLLSYEFSCVICSYLEEWKPHLNALRVWNALFLDFFIPGIEIQWNSKDLSIFYGGELLNEYMSEAPIEWAKSVLLRNYGIEHGLF